MNMTDFPDGANDNIKLKETFYSKIDRRIQHYLDLLTPFTRRRWFCATFYLLVFFSRVVYCNGFFVVAYALSIFLLNQFILFLTPRSYPGMANITGTNDDKDFSLSLPQHNDDEFRPFIRRLPEFKFWWIWMKAISVCLVLTLFNIFDVPVFWPILVIYFFALFIATMRRQIEHMIQYKYLPFSWNKKVFHGKENSGKTYQS
ncbi:hypothetical protein SNEBB_000308 [Seison nebaliae]|nr:hypothetical protein SNEBB_000308 [Seison nebaliae]